MRAFENLRMAIYGISAIRCYALAMKYISIIWDEDGDPEGNVTHILEHGLLPSDVEWVIEHATAESLSRS